MIGPKVVSLQLEFVAKLAVIVDLAVEDHPDAAILVRHRLCAAGKIENRQPAETKCDVAIRPEAFVIRASVSNRIGHPPHALRRVGQATEMQDACYAAHLIRLALGRLRRADIICVEIENAIAGARSMQVMQRDFGRDQAA